jgi:hypothetical protein
MQLEKESNQATLPLHSQTHRFRKGSEPMSPLSFTQAIRPLFREHDIQEMKEDADFDLSKYEDVRARSADIYERLADGSMPSDGAWPAEHIAKFKKWMDEGMAP